MIRFSPFTYFERRIRGILLTLDRHNDLLSQWIRICYLTSLVLGNDTLKQTNELHWLYDIDARFPPLKDKMDLA